MKLGELDIKKAYFGTKELTQNNAYIGTIPIIKDEEIPNNEIWYTSSDGNIVTPFNIDTFPTIISNTYNNGKGIIKFKTNVINIINAAFYNCTNLTSIVIPNNVINIENYAFTYCSSLTSITIPNSVTSIGSDAFNGCTSLTSLTIGNSVTSIGDNAFSNCTGLTSITIPNNVINIGRRAFFNCSNLTSIIIGNNVTNIGEGAFSGTTNLISVTINSNAIINPTISYTDTKNIKDIFGFSVKNYIIGDNVNTDIGNFAFYKYTGLASVIIGNNVTNIGEDAFSICNDLISVIIGNNVTSIGNRAFSGCVNLDSITIGNSVTSIGVAAFFTCVKLTHVYINNISTWCNINFNTYESNPLSYANRLYINNIEVIDLIIPEDVISIGNYAFNNWSNLVSVIIGNNVIRIGEQAFNNCTDLTSIIIPNSVTYIESYAFGQIQAKILFSKLYSTYTNKIFANTTTAIVYNVEFNISEIPTNYNISSMLPQNDDNAKNTLTYNIYTDYAPCKDQALALINKKTIVNVYHIDGTPWE